MNRILQKITFTLLFFMGASNTLSAIDGVWINPAQTIQNWSTPANWQGGLVPSVAGDTATFPSPLEHTLINVDLNVELASISRTSTTYGQLRLSSTAPQTFSVTSSIYGKGFTGIPNGFFFSPSLTTSFPNTGFNVQVGGASTSDYISFYGSGTNLPSTPISSINFIGTGAVRVSPSSNWTTANIASGVQLQADANGTYAFNTAGAGSLSAFDSNTVTFSGDLAHTGGINIRSGTAVTLTGTPPASGPITNAGSLTVNVSAGTPTISGNISGTGSFTKAGTEPLTLSGTCSYTGATSLTAGSLTFSGTPPTSSAINLAGGTNLTFSASSGSLSYGSVISGTGDVIKSGGSTLTFSGTNTYSGATTVSGGTLSITGSLSNSPITVDTAGTLTGTGTVGILTNQGTVEAGLAAGDTLTTGDFTQEGTGTLICRLSPTVASKLSSTGTADLAGTLTLSLSPGVYPTGTSFTVLEATTVSNDFSTFNDGDPANVWTKTVGSTTVLVTLESSSVVVIPVSLSSLRGNESAVGNYFFGDGNFAASNPDLTVVADAMANLPAQEFKDSLLLVSPLACAALPLSSYQNDLQMAVVLDKQFQKNKKKNQKNKQSILFSAIPQTGAFIEPIGIFYDQKSTNNLNNVGQVGFQSYTYGAGMGWEQILDDQFIVEGGIGYTHSNLHWDDNFGNARWSTLYLAPFFGWFNKRAFGNFMIMAGLNFHHTTRKIQFTGLDRFAKSRYTSYDLLLRGNGGFQLYIDEGFWFQPEATLNYLTVFTPKYTERGAGSINLQMKSNVNYILQPSIRTKIVKQFITKKFCYSPALYMGWLANILLKQQSLAARFEGAPNQTFFSIEGYRKTTHQMIVGGEFYLERFNKFNLTSCFEADLFSKLQVYTVKVKFEWVF